MKSVFVVFTICYIFLFSLCAIGGERAVGDDNNKEKIYFCTKDLDALRSIAQ